MGSSEKFLCCLPVRLGVFILSLIECFATGALAGFLWYYIITKRDLFGDGRGAVIGVATVSSILAVACFLGFIGSINRSHRLVNAYSSTLNWLFGVNVALGIYVIVVLLTESNQTFLDRCIDGSTDQDVIDSCNNITDVKVVAVVLVIISWIIQLYECIIVARYVNQLEKEESYFIPSKPFFPSAYAYDPAEGRGQEFSTQPPTAGYAYAETQNSFGGGKGYRSYPPSV